MSLKWKRLYLSQQGDLPPLLFSFFTTANSYELYMTDLTNVWTEQMSRRDILRRADEDATTIDPSEDSEQLRVLLEKIGEALENKPGATASLKHGSQVDSLQLRVSMKLPAPLKPLIWTIYLTKGPQSSMSQHLVLPLLRAEAEWESRQRTLLDHLGRKDWILGKLFDKIESMGLDLSTIFPGVSGLRKAHGGSLVSQAAKYIKGVAAFDENEWLSELARSSPESGLAANILAEMTGSDGDGHIDRLDPPPDGWWEKLTSNEPATFTPPKREQAKRRMEIRPPKSDMAMDTDTDTGNGADGDDEFERQKTPPRLKKAKEPERPPAPPATTTTTSTDDETDHEHEPTRRKSPSPPPLKAPPKKHKALGTIGGKRQARQKSPTPPPQPSPPREPAASAPQPDDDEATDPGSDRAARISPPPKPRETSSTTTAAPKPRGLGVIGGKKKKIRSRSLSPDPKPAPAPPPPTEPKTKRAGKLGVIGGKARAPADVPSQTQPQIRAKTPPSATGESLPVMKKSASPETQWPTAAAAAAAPPEPEPPREETEQERADRKREELKRQLEAKSKAPVKKKRRF